MTLKLEDFEPVGYRYIDHNGHWCFNEKKFGDIAEAVFPKGAMQQLIDQCNSVKSKYAENIAFNKQLKCELAAAQAENERLREALQTFIDEHEECTDADDWMASMCSLEAVHVAAEALATTPQSDALQEHDAKLAERIAENIEGLSIHVFDHINKLADKIRKGEFE